jgi:hypothetical protein
MALDRSLVELYFKGHYKRGAILRFQMKCDDPARDVRNKFAVVLNKDLSETETLLALTTSQIHKYKSPFLEGDVLRIDQGKYACFSEPTIVSLREIRIEQIELLKDKAGKGLLTFEGVMTDTDMTEIDQKLAASRLIEGNILKRIF